MKTKRYANEYNIYDWFNNIAERKIQVQDIDAGSLINIYRAFAEKYKHEHDWRNGKSEITPALQEAIAVIEKYMLERLIN